MSDKKKEENKLTISSQLYKNIKAILTEARGRAIGAVNFIMVEAYWQVGKRIVEEEQKGKKKADYGTFLISDISRRLTHDLGPGFSEQSLRNMRQFYSLFPIRSALRSELSWTHYKILIRVENIEARHFYLNECAESHWSTRQLERQVYSFYYERLLVSKDKLPVKKEAQARAKELHIKTEEQIKDPYVLEFLGIQEKSHLRESELEQGLINHLQSFLLELGRGFCFVARQMRISTETQHFYIDLVFYNYLLKCFVIIDLKTAKLTHQDIGQIDMYVRLFEDKMRQPGDNPTIGIILCTEKDETIVKYSVLKENKKLFASKYKLYLPSEKEFKQELEKEKHLIKLSLEKEQ